MFSENEEEESEGSVITFSRSDTAKVANVINICISICVWKSVVNQWHLSLFLCEILPWTNVVRAKTVVWIQWEILLFFSLSIFSIADKTVFYFVTNIGFHCASAAKLYGAQCCCSIRYDTTNVNSGKLIIQLSLAHLAAKII